nr:uncharacterized protein LOC129264673 [Lytechinus pictus]
MFPGVHPMGNQRKMRGDSEDVAMPKCAATAAENDESFLPPIDSRWSATSDDHDDLGYAESTEGGNQGATTVQSRRLCEKKMSKSGRLLVNKSSMSDSFVLPNISNMSPSSEFRKSRTAGSNWSHGDSRTRESMPMSKSCPILKNRNGYQWGKDSSEEDNDDEDFERDFLSMSYNVMMQSERDGFNHTDIDKNRLAKIEMNSKAPKDSSKTNTNSSSLAETKLPDIFSHQHDRSARGLKDDNNNGSTAERRRARKENLERRTKADVVVKSGQKMEYELDVSPWRGDTKQVNRNEKDDAMVVDGEDVVSNETSKPKAKRKAGNQKLPIKAKNPDSKCIEWLQESHH